MSDLKELISMLSEGTSQSFRTEDLLKKMILKKILESGGDESLLSIEEVKDLLLKRYELLNKRYEFNVGDLVKWKQGLKNKKYPKYNEPAIIVEILSEPVVEPEKNAGSQYFREPLDIVLGIIDSDGDFALFHYDSRRFEPFDK